MSRSSSAPLRQLTLWLDATVVAVALAVVIGGITRLTESGLSITEWKPISGVLPPLSDAAWADAYAKFLQIPQAQTIHAGITLEAFKGIFWWEWVHRIAARLVGLVIAVPFFWFWLRGELPRALRARLAALPALTLAQGALGWYMVSSGLSVRINVSQYRLASHLGLALVIFVIALWTSASLRAAAHAENDTVRAAVRPPTSGVSFNARRWMRVADLFALWTFLVILSGAFVAGLRAGKIYNTFPLMGGRIIPPGYDALDGFVRNAFENPAAAQFHHRVLAILTVGMALALWLWVKRAPGAPTRVVRAQRDVAVVATAQLLLGIVTLLLAVPIAIAALHQLMAVALLGTAVLAAHTARQPATSAH